MQTFAARDLVDLSEIGVGQSGAVVKTLHLPTGRVYARKRLMLRAGNNARTLKALTSELAASERLLGGASGRCLSVAAVSYDHPADLGVSLLTEFAAHGSLALILRRARRPFPEYIVGYVARELLWALADLHRAGILHRDIKPGNVVVDRLGRVRLCDFGESSAYFVSSHHRNHGQEDSDYSDDDNHRGGHRRLHSQVGTMAYMAPERILGHEYDDRSEVWSCGVMLLELALGQHPLLSAGCADGYAGGRPTSLPTPPLSSFGEAEGGKGGLDRLATVNHDLKSNDEQGMTMDLAAIELAEAITGEDLLATGTIVAGLSRPLAHFLRRCVERDAKRRARIPDLLRHPFILKYSHVNEANFLEWLLK
jgi:serine/threonine protein kinase